MYKVPAVLICTCRYKVKVHKTCYTLSSFTICICVCIKCRHIYIFIDIYKSNTSTSTAPSEQTQPIPTTLLEVQTRNPVCRFRPGWAGVGFGGVLGDCSRVHVHAHVHAESRTNICCTDGRWEWQIDGLRRNRRVGVWLSFNYLFIWLGFVVHVVICGDGSCFGVMFLGWRLEWGFI